MSSSKSRDIPNVRKITIFILKILARLRLLNQDKREDLELATNPEFIAAMEKLIEGLSSTDFDWTKVKKIKRL